MAVTTGVATKVSNEQPIYVGIDVGGTFTDFVVWQAGNLRIHKVPTTPDDQSRAIMQGLNELGLLAPPPAGGVRTAPRHLVTSSPRHPLTVSEATPAHPLILIHGMTVATNALLERRGAATALLTTAGFGDVLVIGRQNRPHLYRLHQARAPLLAPDERRLEIDERLAPDGSVVRPLDMAALPEIAALLAATGTESLAIVFLFSHRNGAHEQAAARALAELLPGLPMSLSSEVLPEYREYERTATTLINAYVQPLVARYLARLEAALAGTPLRALRIMQSSGGVIGLRQAAEQAARVVLSGPAGGAVGAFAVAQQALRANAASNRPVRTPHAGDQPDDDSNRPVRTPRAGEQPDEEINRSEINRPVRTPRAGEQAGALTPGESHEHVPTEPDAAYILTFDMGGTSTDVCLCPGRVRTTGESTITGLPLRLPMIDIHTVGAGGGSIAAVDAGGALQVGPASAGSQPGPACYGRGGERPTVTDADLLLGRLDPAGFLGGGGAVQIDVAAAERVLAQLGAQLGLSAQEAALGVIRVANATMERALRTVSVEQGYDPRDFTLLPFGGAGPLHACDLAESLGMRRILFPAIPGVLSAYGMLVAEQSAGVAQSVLSPLATLVTDPAPLAEKVAALAAKARRTLGVDDVNGAQGNDAPSDQVRIEASLDLRYRGQSYELSAPLALPVTGPGVQAAAEAFHAAHAGRYGYAMPGEAVEAVTLRLVASTPGPQLAQAPQPFAGPDATAARLADRPVWFDAGGAQTVACYARQRLLPGNRIDGPCLVLQYDSTLLLGPGWTAQVDGLGNLVAEHVA